MTEDFTPKKTIVFDMTLYRHRLKQQKILVKSALFFLSYDFVFICRIHILGPFFASQTVALFCIVYSDIASQCLFCLCVWTWFVIWFIFIQGLMRVSGGALYNPALLHGLTAKERWIKSFCLRKAAGRVKHAPSVRIKTQENPEIHGVQQELPGDPHPAAERGVRGVHAVGGEHRAGVSGGCRSETGVTRGGMHVGLICLKSP